MDGKSAAAKQLAISAALKAPKGQYNSFGKYSYRSCEDILEAVKPLLVEHGASLGLTDEVVQVGGRYYVKATATLLDAEGGLRPVEACGWAREADAKKGMDESQVTGTASSYARKYALNALFLIDDTKDADTDEHRRRAEGLAELADKAAGSGERRPQQRPQPQQPSQPQRDAPDELSALVDEVASACGVGVAEVQAAVKGAGCTKRSDAVAWLKVAARLKTLAVEWERP